MDQEKHLAHFPALSQAAHGVWDPKFAIIRLLNS